jgi:hypothetical protein
MLSFLEYCQSEDIKPTTCNFTKYRRSRNLEGGLELYTKRFGGFSKLRSSMLEKKNIDVPDITGGKKKITKKQVDKAIISAADLYGKYMSYKQYERFSRRSGNPSKSVVVKFYGTLKNALEEVCGYNYDDKERKLEDYFCNICADKEECEYHYNLEKCDYYTNPKYERSINLLRSEVNENRRL